MPTVTALTTPIIVVMDNLGIIF